MTQSKTNIRLQLASYAVQESISRGRNHFEASPQYRTEFQRDRDRVVHSAAFRRLEYKTQVFVNHEGDMFRTRLTHSIEVAQIGRSIARSLHLNEELVEAISLAHDLGHTPFGHAGQDALNRCMQAFGGFEHNLQSLRIVDELEERYAEFSGLNLMFETREGILKHCSVKKAKELGEVGKRFIENLQPSLEAQLANLADEIAYNNHDIDDGLRAGLLSVEQLGDIELFREQFNEVKSLYPNLPLRRTIHEIVRRMINKQVTDLIENSMSHINAVRPATLDDVRHAKQALVRFSDEMRRKCNELKSFLRRNLYEHYRVKRMTSKSARVVTDLFIALNGEPALLPPEVKQKITRDTDDSARARIVADYIAGMTDRFAIKEYERIFNPAALT